MIGQKKSTAELNPSTNRHSQNVEDPNSNMDATAQDAVEDLSNIASMTDDTIV